MKKTRNKAVNSVFYKFWSSQESGIIIATLLFIVIVNSINPVFSTWSNLSNVLRSTGFTLIVALGMTLVFVGGGLDISVGSTLAVGSTITTLLLKAGVSIPTAIVFGVLAGLCMGFFNGIVIVKLNISPLIVTLGTQYVGRGIVYILTKGVAVYPLPKSFLDIEQVPIAGIPKIVIIAFGIAVIMHILLNNTTFGRSVYALGGNKEAARLSGIRITSTGIACYAITGACAAFAGIMMASRLGSGQSGAGLGLEMPVIAAVIIGGTSINGGSGTILGTVLGALFMNILENSMTLMKISVYWQNLVVGLILIFAVILDQYKRKQSTRGTVKSIKSIADSNTGS